MNGPSGVSRWARLVFGLVVALIVGVVAYNFGFSHGLLQRLPAGAAGPYPWPYHPWGFGFGFLLPLLFMFFVMRALLWGGMGRGRWHAGYARCGGGPASVGGVPLAFDEWHRRAHERDKEQPPAPRA